MKINNKGFTFVEILAVIVIIGLLTGISIAAFSRYKENAIKSDYEALARSSYNAMEEYMMSHPYDDTVSLETLENENLLSNRKDPGSKEDCTGTVEVKKNAGTNGKIDDGTYKVHLCCVSIKKTYTYPGGTEKDLTDRSKCNYVPEEPVVPPTPGTKYTLHYNDNGGSGCSSKSITKNAGEAWGSLCTPTKSGNTFKGWKRGSETITSSSIANGNITVTAQWNSTTTTKVTLKYNDNGGSGCSNKSITRNKNEVWGTLCTPKRSGHTFNGWTDSKGKKYTSSTKAIENVTVKANWLNNTTPTYTVTLNNNGATKAGTGSVKVQVGNTKLPAITVPKKEVTITYTNKVGATVSGGDKSKAYTLNGWYTAKTGGSKVANNASTPVLQKKVSGYTDSNGKWTKKGDSTLYAQWASVTIKLPTITKTGNTCKWTTVDGGKTVERASGGSWTFTSANSRTFTAVCTVNSYTCAAGKYLPKNKTSCSNCTSGNYCKGGTFKFNPSTDQGLSKCPNCYPSSSAGSSKINQCFADVKNNQYVNKVNGCPTNCPSHYHSQGQQVYYGKTNTCTIDQFTLKYNDDGGTGCSGKTITRNYNTAWGELCKPTRAGYEFKDWYTQKNEDGKHITKTSKATQSITVYANWYRTSTKARIYYLKYRNGDSKCTKNNGYFDGSTEEGHPWRRYDYRAFQCYCEVNSKNKYTGVQTKEPSERNKHNGNVPRTMIVTYNNNAKGEKSCSWASGYYPNQNVSSVCFGNEFNYGSNDFAEYHGYIWYKNDTNKNGKFHGLEKAGGWYHNQGNYDDRYRPSGTANPNNKSQQKAACEHSCRLVDSLNKL